MPLSLAYEILYYQSVALEVAPRLKNREINELEKTRDRELKKVLPHIRLWEGRGGREAVLGILLCVSFMPFERS